MFVRVFLCGLMPQAHRRQHPAPSRCGKTPNPPPYSPADLSLSLSRSAKNEDVFVPSVQPKILLPAWICRGWPSNTTSKTRFALRNPSGCEIFPGLKFDVISSQETQAGAMSQYVGLCGFVHPSNLTPGSGTIADHQIPSADPQLGNTCLHETRSNSWFWSVAKTCANTPNT